MHVVISEIITFCVITLCVRKVITICVERLLHFALKILLHFASMLLHFALVLHFAAIIITFCGDYYILRRNNGLSCSDLKSQLHCKQSLIFLLSQSRSRKKRAAKS